MSILRIHIAAVTEGEDEINAPADRILEVTIIGGMCTLRTYRGDVADEDQMLHDIEVPAMSLLRALETGIADDASPLPERLQQMVDAREALGP